MSIEKEDLDAIGQACKEILEEELEPIKERLDALENGSAGKSTDEDLEAQVAEMKSSLDQTLGASKSLVDDDGQPIAEKSQPRRDAWGRRVR